MLELQSVSVELRDPLRGTRTEVISRVDLHAAAGEAVVLLGPNGAGKTTLLLAAAGVLPLSGGTLRVCGRRVSGTKGDERWLRERVGVALQFPERGFFAATVEEELAFMLLCLGRSRAERASAVRETLARVGLPESYASRPPHSLSGGEKRLVGLAAALAHRPSVLLLDEPEVGLDAHGLERVGRIIRDYKEGGGTALVVAHDLAPALEWADRLLLLEKGRVTARLETGRMEAAGDWKTVGAWLWDEGRLGAVVALLRRAGFAVPSPYAKPQAFVAYVKEMLEVRSA